MGIIKSLKPADGLAAEGQFDAANASDLHKMLNDWRLTTAEILYHLPDHPTLLQSYIWQDIDIAPKYPTLTKFLAFWERSIEGRLHSVKLASSALIRPAEFRMPGFSAQLH